MAAPRLRAFGDADLDGAVMLSGEAGWPHRRDDWALMASLSQGFAAENEGRLVGTAFVTPFGPVATVNMVIVARAMRGRGLGRRLMDAALDAAGARTARLVATEDGLPLYRKLGFRETGEIRQHQGVATRLPARPEGVAWAGAEDIDAFLALDRAATGMERTGLFRALAGFARFATIRAGDGRPVAFAAVRRFGRGEVIGPVVAADAPAALALVDFVVASRPGAFLRLDTARIAEVVPHVEHLGLARVGGGIAMVRGGEAPEAIAAPAGPLTYALASQALG